MSIRVADFKDTLSGISEGNVDLILTDPPYGISKYTGFHRVGGGVKRFAVSMDYGEWDKRVIDLRALSDLSYRALRVGGTAIIWYDFWKLSYLSAAMREAGFKQLRWVIWEKTNPVPLNSSVNYLTGCREVAVLGVKVGNPTFNAEYHSGVFNYRIPMNEGGKRKHPTQKPLRLFRELIGIHSHEGDLVVDPFLGSGTTAVAALQTQRKFVGGDASSYYIGISKERLRQAAMQQALW